MRRPQVLIHAATIQRRVRELGHALTRRAAGRPMTVLVLMDGAFCFAADLVRNLPLDDLALEFRRASSYRGTTSTGTVRLEPLPDLGGRLVTVVDDILDTGRTLAATVAAAQAAGAAEVLTCVLLDKPARREPEGLPHADLVGFTIPDRFVVGYGLDHDGRWRGLPDVRVLD